MRVLLLGATGRTGKIVLSKALEKGYHVNCLARNTERIEKKDGLTIFEGNPTNITDIKQAITECDSVISVLNISRKSDFPWAGLRTPETFLSDVMKHLVRISESEKLKRVALCSAWGVFETKNHIPKWFRWLIDNSTIGVAYKGHEKQEHILSQSNLNWTIVRPVGLYNSNKEEKVRETFNNDLKPSLLISRRSLATYLVESLEKDYLIKKTVVISKEIT